VKTPGAGIQPVVLGLDGVDAISDAIVLRDVRGRGPRPSLQPLGAVDGTRRLRVRGPFNALQRFAVTAAQGRRFANSTRDDNPIHVADNVVPGAMTVARILLLPELLLPGFIAENLRVKFSALSRYDTSTFHRFRFHPRFENDALARMEISFEASQGARIVASGRLRGSVLQRVGAGVDGSVAVPVDVRSFLRSLDVDSDSYLRQAGDAYPHAFLAALPSGEMVRQLRGEGGLLNVLDLCFVEGDGLPLSGGDPPEVEVQGSVRPGSSFSKVLTRVVQGVRTYCQGFAMVFRTQG